MTAPSDTGTSSFRVSSLPLLLWSGVAFASLGVILMAFILTPWSWGLMDDYRYVTALGNYWERAVIFVRDTFAGGKCYPVYALHSAILYKAFEHHPGLFYVFRWAEVTAALGAWGFFAFLITRRAVAFPLLICIALSFYRLYDAFFYLATPEILGVLFSGCAGISLFKAFGPAITRQGRIVWPQAVAGTILMLVSFASREMFVAFGVAWGLSLIVSGLLRPRKLSVWASGLLFLLVSLLYGLFLKLFISKGYTSAYTISDPGKLLGNITIWARQSLVTHIPWLMAMICLLFVKGEGLAKGIRVWAVSLGIGFYSGYVLILLPWETWGYYTTPLGVFFAFLVTVLVADRMEKIRARWLAVTVAAALALNFYVGGAELLAATIYQQDTSSLMKWLANNVQFEFEVTNGAVVRTNAWEPGARIPTGTKLLYGKTYETFAFTPKVGDILADPKTRYYLYGPNWGDQDLSRLGRIWYPVFVSKNWVMFRRLY